MKLFRHFTTTPAGSRPVTRIALAFLALLVAVVQSGVPVAAQTIPAPPENSIVFQTAIVDDATGTFRVFPPEEDEEGGPPSPTGLPASMTATISSIKVISKQNPPEGQTPDDIPGVIGGDVLEFDLTITNTSPSDSNAVLTAFAFQSKFSESPALASRIGDKLFYATLVPDAPNSTPGPMSTVKKNGTSNGLFSGKWKGICVNSSDDFLPEFNSGLEDESLECAGSRADTNSDGEPEVITNPPRGLNPGQSQTIRMRLDSGTTDGALHRVPAGSLRGKVAGTPVTGPNGVNYFVPTIDNTGVTDPNVLALPDFGDNKVLRNADGTFNPTFAPSTDGFTFSNQQYLTLPRVNYAFTDILGRNHTCGNYGLTIGACEGTPEGSPVFGFLGTGDLVPGMQNFAAILHGFGEFVETAPGQFARPSQPYGVECENCGGAPFTPIAEFYVTNADGTVTRQIMAGSYGELGTDEQYTATISSASAGKVKQEAVPEPEEGGGPPRPRLNASAGAHFHDLDVQLGAGVNGGDVIQFSLTITNTTDPLVSPDAYLTAFNYQTKRRGLADIGILDGTSQDRRDIRLDSSLPPCASLEEQACWNASLGVGHFPNVIGNGLLFGQMVWPSNVDRAGQTIISDLVHVDPSATAPPAFKLESVKKNGPFTPILKGNVNFICVKSGLFEPDPDADAACAGQPMEGSQRLGLAPGESQSVRLRMEFGDFRGAMLQILPGTLTANADPAFGLRRAFDCSDQRELEFCHPDLVGTNIGYLPNTSANWLTPVTLEEIEYVIVNQPGDAPRVMNFADNFGYILAMSGFRPSAEFYTADLTREQVLGTYTMTPPALAPSILSTAPTTAAAGQAFTYDVEAVGFPAPLYSLDTAPSGMTINASTGLVQWTPAPGNHPVQVRASNGTAPDALQAFSLSVPSAVLDDFNRRNSLVIGGKWQGVTFGYAIHNQRGRVTLGGPIYWNGSGAKLGINQSASVMLVSVGNHGEQSVLLKTDGLQSGIRVVYDAKAKKVEVHTLRKGQWKPTIYKGISASFGDGDRLGATVLASGQVQVFKSATQVGAVTLSATDKKYFATRGGRIGLWFSTHTVVFDDFSGGNVGP